MVVLGGIYGVLGRIYGVLGGNNGVLGGRILYVIHYCEMY